MEGFSEALAGEMAAIGVKVTIIEPGPFRTDFLGRSGVIAKHEIPDYASALNPVREYFHTNAGRQRGDPAKAVLFNLVSLSATFGLITWFWQDGHGSSQLFGVAATGAITFWVPLMIIAFLFGLSMDYEVFILSRMREEYDRTGSTRAAVVEGLGRTGRLVTSAALILFLAFASLGSAPETDIKVFATALGVGILLDATVVRALLLPALVALFGRWNWWMPTWASRALLIPTARRPVEAREAAA